MEGTAGTRHARGTLEARTPLYRWVTIGGRPFDFLGVVGGKVNFRKEYHFLKTDSEGENSCKEIPGEKKSDTEKKSFMAYNAGKKSYTVVG